MSDKKEQERPASLAPSEMDQLNRKITDLISAVVGDDQSGQAMGELNKLIDKRAELMISPRSRRIIEELRSTTKEPARRAG